jgi:hypothetical protein
MTIFCKHDWEIVKEITLPSLMDSMLQFKKDNGLKVSSLEGNDFSLFRRKYILILKCKHCGELDKNEYWNDY